MGAGPGDVTRRSNVIVAHWPKPGSGTLVRPWHCLTCKATIYDDEPVFDK
jgi:hypothetical protein